jgi:hypothetical protein
MSLNVDGLLAYTDEQKMPLIKKSVLGGRTLQFITIQADIKSSAAINILDSTLSLQAGGCGFTDAGSTILTQRDLSVCPLKVNESICLDTLEQYWVQSQMQAGSYNEAIPFEQMYAEQKAELIAASIEDNIWKGNSPAFTAFTACDGFINLFENTAASGSTINGNTGSVTALTAGNIIAVVDAMVSSVATDIIDAEDLILFMGYDSYRLWATALRNANLFHYTGAENQVDGFSQVVPGTNVRVVATRGLNNTNRMYLSRAANFYFGTDLLNDYENFSIFYSMDNQEVRFVAKFKIGTQVAFPGFVSAFKLV